MERLADELVDEFDDGGVGILAGERAGVRRGGARAAPALAGLARRWFFEDRIEVLTMNLAVLGAQWGDEGKGKVIGIDLLEIEPIAGVDFQVMDFLDPDAPAKLKAMLGGGADVVMSDMAANTTGHKKTDHFKWSFVN